MHKVIESKYLTGPVANVMKLSMTTMLRAVCNLFPQGLHRLALGQEDQVDEQSVAW